MEPLSLMPKASATSPPRVPRFSTPPALVQRNGRSAEPPFVQYPATVPLELIAVAVDRPMQLLITVTLYRWALPTDTKVKNIANVALTVKVLRMRNSLRT